VTTLVTGATGFLGRHLVAELTERGDSIRVLARSGSFPGEVQVVRGAIEDDDAVRSAAAGCGLVFHLAGIVAHDRREAKRMHTVNVEGTRRLLRSVDRDARVVHVSSVAAIGPVTDPAAPADESQQLPPWAEQLVYARTKREAELSALAAAADGLDVVVANPAFLLGPGDVHRVSTWPVFDYLAGKIRFTTAGGLSFVDARDVATGLVAIAERGRAGERTILSAAAGNLSWDDFFAVVARVGGKRRHTLRVPRSLAPHGAALVPGRLKPDEVRAASNWWFYNPAKAVRELGFRTRPLEETIRDTIADTSS
jgi:dihydroflavonol-4-reductase